MASHVVGLPDLRACCVGACGYASCAATGCCRQSGYASFCRCCQSGSACSTRLPLALRRGRWRPYARCSGCVFPLVLPRVCLRVPRLGVALARPVRFKNIVGALLVLLLRKNSAWLAFRVPVLSASDRGRLQHCLQFWQVSIVGLASLLQRYPYALCYLLVAIDSSCPDCVFVRGASCFAHPLH